MTGCKDAMRLDLDLGEDVSRDDLKSCLDSGWSADEIAEELELDGAADVRRWCLYHDLPAPRVVAGAADTTQPIKIIPKEAAAGGKSEVRGAVRGVVTETSAPKAATRYRSERARRTRAAAAAQSKLTSAQAQLAYIEAGSLALAAKNLKITIYRVKLLLAGHVGKYEGRRDRHAHRRDLVAIAIHALKRAGASLTEVCDLICVAEVTARAIYNGGEE